MCEPLYNKGVFVYRFCYRNYGKSKVVSGLDTKVCKER